MREHPILFSGEMIAPIFDDRKDVTRRTSGLRRVNKSPNDWSVHSNNGALWRFDHTDGLVLKIKCPYGVPKDILWVRENFITFHKHTAEEEKQVAEVLRRFENMLPSDNLASLAKQMPRHTGEIGVLYKADFGAWADDPDCDLGPWKPSIHLPRSLSRLQLEVISIRPERLHAITEEDAKREGVAAKAEPDVAHGFGGMTFQPYVTAFANKWEELHGKYSWGKNDWLWRVEFRRIA